MTERLMSAQDLVRVTGLGRTTIWRMEREGKFPRRRRIVGHRVGWLESEVTEWMRGLALVNAPDTP